MHQSAQSSLALDDAVWDTHLAAQSWQEDDELNWIHIVGNDDQLGLLALHQRGDSVHTCTEDGRPLGRSISLSSCLLLSAGQQPLLLLLLGLWPVLVGQLEQLCGGLAVQSLGELVDCRGNLQTLVEDGALPLQADVTRPFHKACQITLGLDILSDAEVLWPLLEQGVDYFFGLMFLGHRRGRCHLLPLSLLPLRLSRRKPC